VVETARDVMAIEDTNQFNGRYHVLGGVISPLDGIGPADLSIDLLLNRIKNESTNELIMAISPTIEGETTIYYISKLMKDMDIKVSVIARGVAFGGDLEYADELTLGRSIVSRIPYNVQS
jgi:recombination protein RecR